MSKKPGPTKMDELNDSKHELSDGADKEFCHGYRGPSTSAHAYTNTRNIVINGIFFFWEGE